MQCSTCMKYNKHPHQSWVSINYKRRNEIIKEFVSHITVCLGQGNTWTKQPPICLCDCLAKAFHSLARIRFDRCPSCVTCHVSVCVLLFRYFCMAKAVNYFCHNSLRDTAVRWGLFIQECFAFCLMTLYYTIPRHHQPWKDNIIAPIPPIVNGMCTGPCQDCPCACTTWH